MMSKIILFCLALIILTGGPTTAQDTPSAAFVGETITYSIKKLMKVGEASLEIAGPQTFEGKEYFLIIFRSDAINFHDEEKIYADPATLLPKIVLRDLNIFGKKEQIREEYLDDGSVVITKVAGGKTTRQTIQSAPPLDNIYCFIYRYRIFGTFKVGEELEMHLPTKDVRVKLVEKTEMKAAGKVYDAYYMESETE